MEYLGGIVKIAREVSFVLIEAWTPHDLRRTGATMMQEMGIGMDIIDRCQNHVLAGSKVRRHYLKYEYKVEKTEAFEKLGKKLQGILKDSNVNK